MQVRRWDSLSRLPWPFILIPDRCDNSISNQLNRVATCSAEHNPSDVV